MKIIFIWIFNFVSTLILYAVLFITRDLKNVVTNKNSKNINNVSLDYEYHE